MEKVFYFDGYKVLFVLGDVIEEDDKYVSVEDENKKIIKIPVGRVVKRECDAE